jgi:vancomycin permeability regulator SanA
MGVRAVGVISDRRRYPGRRLNAMREWIARVRAGIDTGVLGSRPRFGGSPIPIGERDAGQTHDRHTREADARAPRSQRTPSRTLLENTPS